MNPFELFNNNADYSSVEGSDLPFEFELDTEESILDPPEGSNQKFVYKITAKGKETPSLKDLNYFLLSISPTISLQDIINPIMMLNGKIYDKGELSIVDDREHDGLYGLKVLFKHGALSRILPTVFTFSFELAKAVPIGPVNLEVKGGAQILNNLKIDGPVFDEILGRGTVVHKKIEICTPVEVTPIVHHGCVTTRNCGMPVVSTIPCSGGISQKCKFYVRQNMRVRIPLSYSARAEVGTSTIGCGCPGGTAAEFIEDIDLPDSVEETENL